MSELSPFSGVKRKSDFGAVRAAFDTHIGHRLYSKPCNSCARFDAACRCCGFATRLRNRDSAGALADGAGYVRGRFENWAEGHGVTGLLSLALERLAVPTRQGAELPKCRAAD